MSGVLCCPIVAITYKLPLCGNWHSLQVYRGMTLDGLDVAIKVQRPNLRHVVVRDIYILRLGVRNLETSYFFFPSYFLFRFLIH